ncbi:MAG: DUF4139 domain-containing protein [Candidatus Omnitrophica bacterium]|nr:DUF4139 domain-containing protein [Candidatus Omnitrophota bacterium]
MRRTIIFAAVLSAFLPFQLTAGPVQKSTLEDQLGVEVTIYNSHFGVVKDTRKIALAEGPGELRFMDVASSILPVTVRARSLNQPDAFAIREQNYEYDLINEAKLLDKYIGQEIKLVDWNYYQDKKETVTATLLSNNQGPVYQVGNEIYLNHPGFKVLPKIPENLIAKPTLTWLYDNQSKTPHELEVSYMTDQINWKADYVFVLNQDDHLGGLSGWVTLDNQSGTIYQNARLKLVAGDVRRVRETRRMAQAGLAMNEMVMDKSSAFQEESFFEYHLYDLDRPTTIKDRQTKQIALLEAENIKLEKEYLVYGMEGYYVRQYGEENLKQPVAVHINFKNSQENQLGMPLPAGIIRFYKKDSKGSLQFVGEDQIKHTPKNETVKAKLGDAFDIVAERVQKDYRQISNDTHESEWEITLRNHKKEDITVGIIEPLYASWEILSHSHPYEKKDAHTIRLNVPVPKDGEVKVTYRIRVSTSFRVRMV